MFWSSSSNLPSLWSISHIHCSEVLVGGHSRFCEVALAVLVRIRTGFMARNSIGKLPRIRHSITVEIQRICFKDRSEGKHYLKAGY